MLTLGGFSPVISYMQRLSYWRSAHFCCGVSFIILPSPHLIELSFGDSILSFNAQSHGMFLAMAL
jgi:hypothetical protein